ncbi:MAG: tRNA (adenine-N1)-methyltransferase [Peptococcaceae bacterium]|nr:tRNA (adenine-N1)-methyltransferase [Peptococcaceae bacterium]
MYLQEGDLVVFIDQQQRSYLKRLKADGRLHTHRGYIDHSKVIGLPPGSLIKTSMDKEVYVFRPRMIDYIMNMPRKSGIIYPKDTAYILLQADIFPGARVILGGVGSGALLLAVARQVGPEGYVWGYDVRRDMLDFARRNISELLGEPSNVTLKLGNIYEQIDEQDVDCILLDVPEPWNAVENCTRALKSGGILLAYTPTIKQADLFTQELRHHKSFAMIETTELLVRDWHIRDRSVRPNHRMVGHTGFLTWARKVVREVYSFEQE